MPAYNRPGDRWFSDRLGRTMADVEAGKKQTTQYIVDGLQECVAIVGNLENCPVAVGVGEEPKTEPTGLTGWGVAVKTQNHGWVNVASALDQLLP